MIAAREIPTIHGTAESSISELFTLMLAVMQAKVFVKTNHAKRICFIWSSPCVPYQQYPFTSQQKQVGTLPKRVFEQLLEASLAQQAEALAAAVRDEIVR